MTKKRLQIYKLIAVNTLTALAVGMFCLGMFMPMAAAAAAMEPALDGCSGFHANLNIQNPLAVCCINHNHINEAIIKAVNTNTNHQLLPPASLPASSLILANFSYQDYNYQREEFPPPASAALASVVKIE
jgi:hypothetical protein